MTDPSNTLSALIRQLESHIGASADGLPNEVFLFVSQITPLINVDLLVQDSGGRTLLTWRSDCFYGPGWHVPGGIIRYKEAAADRIRAVARLELGTAVRLDVAPILVDESKRPDSRDRGHAISLHYRCRLASALDPGRRYTPEAPLPDQWLWHERCPESLNSEQRPYIVFMG